MPTDRFNMKDNCIIIIIIREEEQGEENTDGFVLR
jgi:hypothetical protein